jgi:uncharacterized protein YecE (DUF72 family)
MLWIGTSGWQYAHWRSDFYSGVPQRLQLEHYAEHYATVEINAAFYRLPERSTFEGWRQRTPADTLLAVKASRYLTHIRRLRDPEEPVARLLERAAGLGDKLGPLLLQLPPTMAAQPEDLERTLRAFATTDLPDGLIGPLRITVETRHSSWDTDEIRELLTAYGAALCWADRRSRPITPLWRTADWGYLRLHEGGGRVWPFYGRAALASWLDRVEENFGDCADADVFVYFNNDPGEAALRGAETVAGMARRRNMMVSRVIGAKHAGT